MADQADAGFRLDHTGLTVADLTAARAWFCDVFGLKPELTLRVEALDLDIEMLIHPEHGYRLELLHRPGSEADKPASPAEAALREGYGHIAFEVTDVDAAYDRAVARGARPVVTAGTVAGTRGADGVYRRSGGQPHRAPAPASAGRLVRGPAVSRVGHDLLGEYGHRAAGGLGGHARRVEVERGLRVLPGGDYGFPNNPIGRNARDLELFVRLFGYSPRPSVRHQ